ncbi:diguanylate cyclase [Sulfurospirillum oryzae]|uniref:diguanylate cyclase n=1 Tax=Sulfurospirillum oryzae TaxID=2976535 RepID=UPI0021E8386E|nr:diguanylate cyclase [Sulfurospirillum oryzae]
MVLPNRLVHFDSFEVYFWKRISKNFFYFSCVGLFLSIVYIPFDYQLHRGSDSFYFILAGRATAVFFAIMVVLASIHPFFKHHNVLAITTFGTMGFSAVTLTYLLFGNPVHFVIYSWFFYLVATMMQTPLITNKIFFIMEGYQVAFMGAVMAYTNQSAEEMVIFFSLAIPLVGYVYSVIWLNRKNGKEAYKNALQNHILMSLDGLSNLLNRRTWYEMSRRKWSVDKGSSFVMLDIDHFKKVNDTYGHECGDLVIQSVSQTLLEQTREYDIIGRLGGEEFGILLPQTNLEEAHIIAERIRQKVADTIISYNGKEIRVTISLGLIQNNDAIDDFNTLVVLGDKCLYQAKAEGRNRVKSYEEI